MQYQRYSFARCTFLLHFSDLVPCPRCVSRFKRGHANCGDVEETLPEEITEGNVETL